MRPDFLSSPEALDRFIKDWETAQLPKQQWTHSAHIAVGAVYAVQFPSKAFEKTRDGIRRYNEATGTPNSDCSGYHETITRLWGMVIGKVVGHLEDPYAAACLAVETLSGVRDLHRMYYTFDVVKSVEARRNWVLPDMIGPY